MHRAEDGKPGRQPERTSQVRQHSRPKTLRDGLFRKGCSKDSEVLHRIFCLVCRTPEPAHRSPSHVRALSDFLFVLYTALNFKLQIKVRMKVQKLWLTSWGRKVKNITLRNAEAIQGPLTWLPCPLPAFYLQRPHVLPLNEVPTSDHYTKLDLIKGTESRFLSN